MAEADDKALQRQAAAAEQQANATAGQLTSAGQGVAGTLVPQLERQSVNPPGASPADIATMESRAAQAGAGAAGGARGMLALRAMRMRNPAGVGGDIAASTEAASRATGKGLQDILAQNASLKEKQRAQAQEQLGGIYNTDVSGSLKAMGLEPEDINAGVNAQKVGWLQNAEGIIDTLTNAGKSAASSYGSLGLS
jgi:hypothetical protein